MTIIIFAIVAFIGVKGLLAAERAADPVRMAREIVPAKIEASLKFTVREPDARDRAAEEWKAKRRRDHPRGSPDVWGEGIKRATAPVAE
jgi:hypothetical protein